MAHYLIIGFAAFAVGAGIAALLAWLITKSKIGSFEKEAARIIAEGEKEAAKIAQRAEREAKDNERQLRREMEKELADRRKEVTKIEEHLHIMEENLEKKTAHLDQREQEVLKKEKKIKNLEDSVTEKLAEISKKFDEQVAELQRISGMTKEEALEMLTVKLTEEAQHNAAKRIKEIIDEAKERSMEEAQRIIATAVQRYAGEYAVERTVSVVTLPSDEMKGRIIGREGRNIKALETALGVDIIIDDTPEAIVISGFDPVRREVARLSMTKLIEDGRIHPARIEEIAAQSRKLVEKQIKEYGERAVFDLGIHGMHPDLIRLVGQLRFRYSYSQNIWGHSIEVAYLAGMMAGELGLSVKKARRAGLLHDIGKAVTHEQEGSHAVIGAEIASRFGESKEVINAIEAHHNDVEMTSPISALVQAADALSGARPGARMEIMEQYIKRLQELEAIATNMKGVDKSYAIQAGRELRVIVQAESVSDEMSAVLADEIAKQIENQMTYPGQIKVTVIRETRAIAVAK